MTCRASLLWLLLTVPLVGLAVSEGIQLYMGSQLSSVAVQDLNWLSATAIAAGLIGLLLIYGIRLAGSAARENRLLLLHLFKPGLYLTIVVLIGLVFVHGMVAIGVIYYAESVLIGIVTQRVLFLIGIGALLGIAGMARSLFALVRRYQMPVFGVTVNIQEAPALWKAIQKVAQEMNALAPQSIVLGLDPNFFVTEEEVICLNGKPTGRILYCSLSLCRVLSEEEFLSIVAHELGHYKGLDTRFSQKFFPIYRGTRSAMASLDEASRGGLRGITLLPAIAILGYFFDSFSLAESSISRSRELAADRESAAVSGERTVAAALVKVHAYGGGWEEVQQIMVDGLREGKAPINASKTYAEVVSVGGFPEALDQIAETHLAHPTDSHPPLAVRLEALGIHVQDISAAALDVRPPQPAISLLPDAEIIEQNISTAYQSILSQELGIRSFSEDD